MTTHYAESAIFDERIESPVRGAPIVQIRSIEVTDAALIREFVQSLSLETRYLRFMSPLNRLSAQMVDLLIGHRRDTALMGIVHADGEDRVVGIASFVANADAESCDFGIVVADDWQRRGLGSRLLGLLVDTASARGLKRIGGDVLAINEPMKAFAKAHGFTLSRSHDDPTLVRVELRLHGGRA